MISLAFKLYNRMILNRIHSPIDVIHRKNQVGSRTGRSCIQHILRRIMLVAHSQNIHFLSPSSFLKKGLDSIDRDMMFAILQHYFCVVEFLTIVSSIRSVCFIQSFYIQGKQSKRFAFTPAVLQGDQHHFYSSS